MSYLNRIAINMVSPPLYTYGCNIACTTVSENEEFPNVRRLVRVPLGQSACMKRLVDWDHALFIEI